MKRSIRIADDEKVIITGNRLRDGRIVWLSGDDRWMPHISQGELLHAHDFQKRLEWARAEGEHAGIVDIYEVPVRPGHVPEPVSMREKIRAQGPSVHPQFATVFP